MPKRRKNALTPQKTLDMFSAERRRGRPGVRPSLVSGRAYNYGLILNQIWDDSTNSRGEILRGVGDALLKAQTEDEVIRAFDPWPNYQRDFARLARSLLEIRRDKDFPKTREPQIRFLADSLGGSGLVSARRSRDICEQERAREKKATRILRYEWYIECSCRYKGKSRNHACPRCGAQIDFSLTWALDRATNLNSP
jgi:hypothetical protein